MPEGDDHEAAVRLFEAAGQRACGARLDRGPQPENLPPYVTWDRYQFCGLPEGECPGHDERWEPRPIPS